MEKVLIIEPVKKHANTILSTGEADCIIRAVICDTDTRNRAVKLLNICTTRNDLRKAKRKYF